MFKKISKKKLFGIPILMLIFLLMGAIFIKPIREMIDKPTGGMATGLYKSIIGIFSKNNSSDSDLEIEEVDE